MGASILVVEDDHDVADVMVRALSRYGHTVEWVTNGSDAVPRVAALAPDVVLLDLGLPDMDGLEVCERVRSGGYRGEVLAVTARWTEDDVAAALHAGADDFLTKPFGLAQLLARVNQALRPRPCADEPRNVTTSSGLTLDTSTRRARFGQSQLPLTGAEFDALTLLAADPGTVVPTSAMVTTLWGDHTPEGERAIALTIRQLRRKLERADVTDRIAVGDGGFTLREADV
jgi:DNA-binding response OmpR family regulator